MESSRISIRGEWQKEEAWVTGSGYNNAGSIVAFDLDKSVEEKQIWGESVSGKLMDLVVHDKVQKLAEPRQDVGCGTLTCLPATSPQTHQVMRMSQF